MAVWHFFCSLFDYNFHFFFLVTSYRGPQLLEAQSTPPRNVDFSDPFFVIPSSPSSVVMAPLLFRKHLSPPRDLRCMHSILSWLSLDRPNCPSQRDIKDLCNVFSPPKFFSRPPSFWPFLHFFSSPPPFIFFCQPQGHSEMVSYSSFFVLLQINLSRGCDSP